MMTTKTRKPKKKIDSQGWEEIERRHHGLRFWGGGSLAGAHVVILEKVTLQRMIDGELHVRTEIQDADEIQPGDLLGGDKGGLADQALYRLIDTARHASNWVQTCLDEDERVKARAKARGTKR